MLSDAVIEALEAKGFKRWTKDTKDRLYIDATLLGLELKYYKTGSVSDAFFNGDRVSNSQGRRYKASKTYIDVKTGTVHADYDELGHEAQMLLDATTRAKRR